MNRFLDIVGKDRENGHFRECSQSRLIFSMLTFALPLLLIGEVLAGDFRIEVLSGKSVGIYEGKAPVFVYNHGIMLADGVPADRARSSYVHPLYGLDGEILTDDFPKDHYHHRGVFWAWPHVRIENKHYDLWMLKGIEHRFERWLQKKVDSNQSAILGISNGWFIGDQKVMQEQVWIRALPENKEGRFIDFDLTWIPIGKAITLEGAEGKSYGGLTIRYAPRTNTVITTPLGQGDKDLSMTRLAWADLTGRFEKEGLTSGAAIFVFPDHPDFAPEWLTRHYGALCLGWPGVHPKTFSPGTEIHCRYRLWVHRGKTDLAQCSALYHSYTNSAVWKPNSN